jgi:DNA-binding MarR family transcriptional regulator
MERREGSGGLAERELLADGEPGQYGSAQYSSAELTLADPGLASGLAAAFERLIGLFRSLSPANGLSLTAAATLATLERSGPCRLTSLAVREGVTQPAMTQLIGRLAEAGLVERIPDPADGRVVQVRLTADGKATLAGRRAVRADRLAGLLAMLSADEQSALAAALPAMEALASAQRSASGQDR